MTEQESRAKRIAQTILEVRGGKMSAKKGAENLGMSRKSFYKWESRGFRGMLGALMGRPAGRPSAPPEDPEKLALKRELERLTWENLKLQKKLEIRDIVYRMETENTEAKKKQE